MTDSFSRIRDLQRIVEDSAAVSNIRHLDAQVRSIVGPLREPYLLDSTLGRAVTDLLNQRTFAQQIMESVAPMGTKSLLHEIERQTVFRDDFMQSFRLSHEQSQRAFKQLQNDLGSHLALLDDAFGGSLRREMKLIADAAEAIRVPTGIAAIATAMDGWSSTLGALHHENAAFASTIISNPLAESARSLRIASTMLARCPGDVAMERTIEQAILLGDAELRATNETILAFAASDVELIVPPPRRLYAPQLHRIELRRMQDDLEDADVEDLLVALPSGQLVLLAREVINLVIQINEVRTIAGEGSMFKQTDRVMRVCCELPFAVALTRSTFADFIDDLYWLFYEAPGAGSLRYLTAHGGPLADDDCEIVFVIKRLRNFYRHDPEHGSDREIEKKFEAIAADLAAHGFNALPRTRDHYRRLQRVVLEEVAAFLRMLHDKLIV